MHKLVLLLLLLKANIFFGQVIVNNTGTSNLNVAICYFDSLNGWTTKGWYKVEAGKQKTVFNTRQLSNTNFYYYAEIADCNRGYVGETPLFVNTKDAFTISNANKEATYNNPNIKKYKFLLVNLKEKKEFVINLNPTNLICNGQKHGKWAFDLDKYGDYVEKKEDAIYKREITFENGKPIGWCKDYYPDSTLKAEFKLLSHNPLGYDGKCTWYNSEGKIEKEIIYKNGSPIKETATNESGEIEIKEVKYETVVLPVQQFFLNSKSNETWKGGKTNTVYPVTLPENTVEWYYEFTSSRVKSEMEDNSMKFSIAAQLGSLVDKTGILKTSVDLLKPVPGANICNIYLLDYNEYRNFSEGKVFKHFPIGTRTNYKSGIVQIRNLNTLKNPIIGIKNPDSFHGIHVSVQVVAIVSKFE